MKFDVYGRMTIEVLRKGGEWQVFRLGDDGKKRRLYDVVIPADVQDKALRIFLDDIYHEWATATHPRITPL